MSQNLRPLGAHMSIAGGIAKSIDRGIGVGCSAIQIFTGFNNRWVSRPLVPRDVEEFYRKRPLVQIILAHNNYLINLASPDTEKSKKSFDSMLQELHRAERLKLPYLVMHPGSHMGEGEKKGLARISTQLNNLIEQTRGYRLKILLETTSGQGTSLGHRFEHLAEILSSIKYPERIGVCLDTCHVFCAGYEIRTPDSYSKNLEKIDRLIGLSKIYAFHLNDSKGDLGSRKDRHQHIGKGFLGLEPFRLILNDPRFLKTPMILETPKGKDMDADKMNLSALRRMISYNEDP